MIQAPSYFYRYCQQDFPIYQQSVYAHISHSEFPDSYQIFHLLMLLIIIYDRLKYMIAQTFYCHSVFNISYSLKYFLKKRSSHKSLWMNNTFYIIKHTFIYNSVMIQGDSIGLKITHKSCLLLLKFISLRLFFHQTNNFLLLQLAPLNLRLFFTAILLITLKVKKQYLQLPILVVLIFCTFEKLELRYSCLHILSICF